MADLDQEFDVDAENQKLAHVQEQTLGLLRRWKVRETKNAEDGKAWRHGISNAMTESGVAAFAASRVDALSSPVSDCTTDPVPLRPAPGAGKLSNTARDALARRVRGHVTPFRTHSKPVQVLHLKVRGDSHAQLAEVAAFEATDALKQARAAAAAAQQARAESSAAAARMPSEARAAAAAAAGGAAVVAAWAEVDACNSRVRSARKRRNHEVQQSFEAR